MAKAKPFIKWVGGKSQLIDQLDAQLPADFGNWENVTYIEPFVGGGAMLFYMIQRYNNIKHAIINDINPDLNFSSIITFPIPFYVLNLFLVSFIKFYFILFPC